MTAVKEQQDAYFSTFQARERFLSDPSWLGEIRRAAMERFAELGFPTTRQEEWRFTNVAPIARVPFELAQAPKDGAPLAKLRELPMADLGCDRLVFVNGRFSPELTRLGDSSQGVKVCNLSEALAAGTPSIEEHLARHARFDDHAFIALNTAFVQDGAYVEIPRGLVLEKPIYLLHVTAANGRPGVTHPRNLVIAGPESQATIIEGYVALDDGAYFTNAVSEVVVGDNAVTHYCRLQNESEQAFHFGALNVRLGRDANATTYSLGLGAALARQEVAVTLDGEGSECQLNGLYVVSGRQHIDNYTTLDHAQPHTASREFYKGVLDEKSSGVFHGRIIVRPGAQKTDAKQSNKNLLLSDDATINTKPQLEIYADDVKCTHGATIGQIDPEAVFYLRSRAIGKDEARRMLTYAFANDIIGRIKYEPLASRLGDAVFARLGIGPGKQEPQ
ncbi:MAG: Fe-S cluster assembly protein SufD [Acidobacteriia bacterium]|nr:Fe-S cluster assembly protein SufD [Terriglobia bacterium]